MESLAVLSFARSERASLIAALAVVAFPFVSRFGTYALFIAAQFAIFAVVALSLDVLMGRTGQISLGHAGFFAIGAYTAALLSANFDTDLLPGALAGAVLAGVASLVVGLPATRLSGHYLGIVTLGFGVAVAQIAVTWSSLTNGDEGVHARVMHVAGIALTSPLHVYVLSFFVLAAISACAMLLPRTPLGRAFGAVRDSEVAAVTLGIPVARTKVTAFVMSAALAAVAGALYAALTRFVAPEDFSLGQSLLFFAMVIVGGTASARGTVLGALLLDAVSQAAATVGGLSLVLIGGAIVGIGMFRPTGLKSLWLPRGSGR